MNSPLSLSPSLSLASLNNSPFNSPINNSNSQKNNGSRFGKVVSRFKQQTLNNCCLAKKTLFNDISACWKVSCENTIWFALNNEAIAKKAKEFKDYTWQQKFMVGVGVGFTLFVPRVICLIAISRFTAGCNQGSPAVETVTCKEAAVFAVLEEVLMRGVIQNAFAGIQKTAIYVSPRCIKNNRMFVWITSPSARILAVNALFAGLHLYNAGTYLTSLGAIIQAASIFYSPSESILHETTGSILAPIGSHLINNLLASALSS